MEQVFNSRNVVQAEDENLDIKRYISLFISNWYWIFMILFIFLSLAYGINKYSEPIYSVTSSILIKDDKENSNLNNTENIFPGGDMFRSQQTLQNEIGILRSYNLNLRAMKELTDFHVVYISIGRRGIAERRLYNQSPFYLKYNCLEKQPTGLIIKIKILSKEKLLLEFNGDKNIHDTLKFGDTFKKCGFDFSIKLKDTAGFKLDDDNSNRFKVWFESPENLANYYRNNLSIQPIDKESTVLSLSIDGFVPDQEAEYLNKLMEVYIGQGLDLKNLTADSTINFIDRQLKVISDSLTKAEVKLQNFKDSNKLINLETEGAAIHERLERFETEKTTIWLQLQYYKYLEDYLTSKNESAAIVSPSLMGVNDPILIKLVNDLATLQYQKKQLLYSFSGNVSNISWLDTKVKEMLVSLDDNVKNNKETVLRAYNDVNGRIATVDHEINLLPSIERQLIKFQRNFDINNTIYTYLLEKRSEAGIARASRISGNRVIDEAVPNNSVLISPRIRRNYLIALILGLAIPAILIFLVDVLNDKIIDKKDIEKGTSVPVIGYVGHSDSDSEIPVFLKSGSALSESFRSIRTNLKYYLNDGKSHVISVTSTISGEGKTFISVNLAAVLAMLGKKTLVIGLDLRKPRMHRIFGSERNLGLSNYLIGENDFISIVKETEIPNLFFVDSGPIPPNPTELIESVKMVDFIDHARNEFEFIVLDTPPIGIVSDALLLSRFAEINMFIVRQRYSTKSTLEFIQNINSGKELKNAVIVVNDIIVSGYYGYGIRYGKGLYSGYGYDYGYGRYGRYNYINKTNYYTND